MMSCVKVTPPSLSFLYPALRTGLVTHTQIHILICKVQETIDVTVQSKTNFAVMTMTGKLSKYKLIQASQFSHKPKDTVVFFK